MKRINAYALQVDYPSGLKLDPRILCFLDGDIFASNSTFSNLANLVDDLSGSKVDAFLVTRKIHSEPVAQLELRYNGEVASPRWELNNIHEVCNTAKFIAACAGKKDEVVEPSRLEDLEGRVRRLEENAGLREKEED